MAAEGPIITMIEKKYGRRWFVIIGRSVQTGPPIRNRSSNAEPHATLPSSIAPLTLNEKKKVARLLFIGILERQKTLLSESNTQSTSILGRMRCPTDALS